MKLFRFFSCFLFANAAYRLCSSFCLDAKRRQKIKAATLADPLTACRLNKINLAYRLRAEFCFTPPLPSECPCCGLNAVTAMRRQAYDSLRASAGCALVTPPLAEEDKAGVKN